MRVCFAVVDTARLPFSKVAAQFTLPPAVYEQFDWPTSVYESFGWSTVSSTHRIICLFHFSHSGGCVVVPGWLPREADSKVHVTVREVY